MPSETEKPTSAPSDELHDARTDERDQDASDGIALPAHVAGSGTLNRLVDTARDYARAAASDNTLKAYAKDWAHFAHWCRMRGVELLPPPPAMIGLYLADLASGSGPSGEACWKAWRRKDPSTAVRCFSISKGFRHVAGHLPCTDAAVIELAAGTRRVASQRFRHGGGLCLGQHVRMMLRCRARDCAAPLTGC
jgi:hypothetical protein